MNAVIHRYRDGKVARLIRERIDALRTRKAVLEIANDAGYEKDKLLLAFAEGEWRVPIDRAVALARALETDPAEFLRAVLESYNSLPDGFDIVYDPARGAARRNVDLNFKVDAEFHRSFKTAASHRGMSMKELLETSVEALLERETRSS